MAAVAREQGLGEGLWSVADALYGLGRGLLSQVRRLGWQAVVAVREGVWRGVKSQERQWAHRLWQEHRDICRRRYLVESWIGPVRTLCGSYLEERGLEMALRAVWGRLLLWDLGLVLLFSSFLGHYLAARHDPCAFSQTASRGRGLPPRTTGLPPSLALAG